MPTRKYSLAESKVIDSRVTDNGRAIRRRRECEKTGDRFTTFERVQAANLMVQKRNGTTEPYDRDKLERGIFIACGKRSVSIDKLQESLSELEEKWGRKQLVKTTQIGRDVLEMLRDIDEVAFIRFASVYQEFKDIETFKKQIEKNF